MLLAFLGGCTADGLDQQNPETKDGYVTMKFTLDDMPYSTIATKTGGETSVGSLSLMTFDASGNFLGRVEATNINRTSYNDETGSAQGTGTATIPANTRIIHFIANYNWNTTDQYVTPNGETESELMPSLESSSQFVAWGRVQVANASALANVTVDLLRNYAKVVVSSVASNFEVDGFALAQYADRGTVTPWGEGTAYENVTSATNANTKITPAADLALVNQSASDVNMNTKYMFEYSNPYEKQTSVIVKKKGAEQYYKIQLVDANKNPYFIERNYIYKVVINTFSDDVKGSDSFDAALKAAPANNIFAEVTKVATTVSDSNGNKLVVTPVFKLFTASGTLSFTANYYKSNSSTTSNSEISLSIIQDKKNILSNLSGVSTTNGTVTANVTVPSGITKVDSATILVKAGLLTRIVTVYVSPIYSFRPVTGGSYTDVGDEVALSFTIPTDFPENLYPIKCRILATDLNPVNSKNPTQLLVEQENGTYYYIYEATTAGSVTLNFKTTRSTVTEPTISNEYFTTATFPVTYNAPKDFTNISAGSAYYEDNSTFELKFTTPTATTVSISGDGIKAQSFKATPGVNTVILTTFQNAASGNITLKADGYNDASTSYSNSYKLSKDKTVTGSIKYSFNNKDVPASTTLVTDNSGVTCVTTTTGQYKIVIKAGTNIYPNVKITYSTSLWSYSKYIPLTSIYNGTDINLY